MVRSLPASAGDADLVPDLGRSHMLWSSWACVPLLLSSRTQESQLQKPMCPRAHVPTRQASTMTSSHSTTKEWLPLPTTRENPHSNKEPAQPKINLKKKFFFKTGNMGRGRRTSLSFWSRQHASIISSSSRLSRVVFLSLCSQARSTNYCFLCGQRACLRGH